MFFENQTNTFLSNNLAYYGVWCLSNKNRLESVAVITSKKKQDFVGSNFYIFGPPQNARSQCLSNKKNHQGFKLQLR